MWLPPNYLQTRALERPNDPSYLASFCLVEYFAVAVFSPGANYTLKDELSYAQTATHCMACRCSPIASKNYWMCNSRYIMHINVDSGWIQMDFWPVGITCILILFFVGLLNVLSKYIKRRQRSSTPTSSIRRALQEHWNLQTKTLCFWRVSIFYVKTYHINLHLAAQQWC